MGIETKLNRLLHNVLARLEMAHVDLEMCAIFMAQENYDDFKTGDDWPPLVFTWNFQGQSLPVFASRTMRKDEVYVATRPKTPRRDGRALAFLSRAGDSRSSVV